MITSQKMMVDGLETFCYVDGSGPPLVLLHGMMANSDCWLWTLEALRGDYTVIAPDLPVHGRTAGLARCASVDYYVRWLERFTQEMGLARFNLLCHSMGGAIGAAFTRRYPGQVRRLVLVDALGMSGAIPWDTVLLLTRRSPFALAMMLTGKVQPYFSRYVRQRILMHPDGPSGETLAAMLKANEASRLRVLLAGTRLLMADFLLPRKRQAFAQSLRQITVPTLIAWGRHDGLLPIRHAHAGQTHMPGARLRIFEASAHMPMLDEPDAFSSTIRRFLNTDDEHGQAAGSLADTRRSEQ